MSQVPVIPENAPFTAEQRLWLNGWLAGLFSHTSIGVQSAPGQTASASVPKQPLVVLYGSQTGTAEGLAKKTAKVAETKGFAPKVVCMEKFESVDLSAEPNVLLITSTYGDGEPPDNALSFWSYLSAEGAPRLENVRYSVLALGDTNYQAFCEFGKKCDERLEALGAKRAFPRTDCDVDYEEPAKAWTEAVFSALAGQVNEAMPVTAAAVEETPVITGFSRKIPFPARLITNHLLTGEGSAKEVRHFEISLEGSGLEYEVGDALGVIPANCAAMVNDILAALGCDGEEAVKSPDGTEVSLRMALSDYYDITKPSSELLKAAAARSTDEEFRAMVNDVARKDDLKMWLWGREVIDVLSLAGAGFDAAELVGFLKKLQPRLYSISSSPKAHPGEVHLTVGIVRHESHGRSRKGVCSSFLADRCAGGTAVQVYIQTSHGFRLPSNPETPVIMVGPGTGIAPFRAFLEERMALGAKGGNWLFFGDQKRATDFLYQEQLEAMQKSGHLTRLDLAFSRDQAEKIYVQNRMLENAAELWKWLQDGAHFYVCGDASRMAKDVDATLHAIAETAGGLSKEAAAEFIQILKSDKRYQRDVY